MKNLSQPDSSIWTKEQKSVSHVTPASGQLADFFCGELIQPLDLTQLIGDQVEYQGRVYQLLDYLPASESCQIDGGGEILIVPTRHVSIPDPF